MKKERKPLTTREKVLIGLSIAGAVATCAAGYFGYKYWENLKDSKALEAINDDLLNGFVKKDDELECVKEELSFLKCLVVESGCTKTGLQNLENKLSRIRKKIGAEFKELSINPTDVDTQKALLNHREFETWLVDKIEKIIQLDKLADSEERVYA